MRKSLWIILTVLLVVIAVPNAYGDAFTPVFTTVGCSGTCLLPTADDVTFTLFGTIDVTFDGVPFTLVTLGLPSDTYTWAGSVSTGNVGFVIFDVSQGAPPITCFGSATASLVASCGGLTFAAVAVGTPEPSSAGLMLLGVGLVFVMRKRIGHGLPRAS
jgi:hypothetical protein